jgi:hypothetical protein
MSDNIEFTFDDQISASRALQSGRFGKSEYKKIGGHVDFVIGY